MEFLLVNLSDIGDAIGWTLIHFLWQGSLLFLTYFIITRLFLKNKINTHYWLGMFIIAMCFIIPLREFYTQLEMTNVNSNSIIHQLSNSINPIETDGILNPFDMLVLLIQKILPYLVITWMLSVFLISSHLFKSWLYLVKLSKDTSLSLPENLIKKLEEASEKLKLKFKPIITISKMIDVPATFGYFKPVILLPTSIIARLPQEQMEAILLHELCHIKRADFLHNILQLIIETLFFYHPLVKWVSKDVRKVREQCCDELVLKLNDKPLVYAKALTNIATIYNSNINKHNATSHIQIAASDGELYQRIKFLMLEKRTKSQFSTIMIGFLMFAFALMTFKSFIDYNANQTKVNSFSTFSNTVQQSESNSDRPFFSVPSIQNINKKFVPMQSEKIQDKVEPITTYVNDDEKNLSAVDTKKSLLEPSYNQIADNFEKSSINNIEKPQPVTQNTLNQEQTDFSKPVKTDTKLVKNSYPKLIKKVNPIYSSKARARGVEGTVILSFNIDRKGRVKKIIVDKSSPLKLLDGSARVALHKWRFDPRSINEHNLNNRYQQIFSFNLGAETNQCTDSLLGTRLKSQTICNDL